jgi:hypothetical protein
MKDMGNATILGEGQEADCRRFIALAETKHKRMP